MSFLETDDSAPQASIGDNLPLGGAALTVRVLEPADVPGRHRGGIPSGFGEGTFQGLKGYVPAQLIPRNRDGWWITMTGGPEHSPAEETSIAAQKEKPIAQRGGRAAP